MRFFRDGFNLRHDLTAGSKIRDPVPAKFKHVHEYCNLYVTMLWLRHVRAGTEISVVVVLRSPIHANEPSEYNGMLYRTSNRVLNNGIKVIILICMDGTSQYHHHRNFQKADFEP